MSDYSIFLDEETGALFAVLRRADDHRMDALLEQDMMRRWWAAMAELMETNPDQSPVVVPLRRVFHLP
jgi:L-rhamnose mutarotase